MTEKLPKDSKYIFYRLSVEHCSLLGPSPKTPNSETAPAMMVNDMEVAEELEEEEESREPKLKNIKEAILYT